MNKQTGLLRGVCIFGLVVGLAVAALIVLLSFYGGIPLFSLGGRKSFSLLLNDYDGRVGSLSVRERTVLLDKLEKQALDPQNSLSLLKRRRAIALEELRESSSSSRQPGLQAYAASAERARKQYPNSGQVGAVAAEALILSSSGQVAEETAAQLLDLASLINRGALQDLALAFSVYSGALGDPATALRLPRELFPLLAAQGAGAERERYQVNYILWILLESGPREAEALINGLFQSTPIEAATFRFGGDFFYDHGNFLRAAELYSHFTDDESLARQADALWLAGYVPSARALWQAAASGAAGRGGEAAFLRTRSFYNLAASSEGAAEEGRWLEQLFTVNAPGESARVFAVLRYSRLAGLGRALAILEQTNLAEGLFDLELVRRRSETWTVDRTVGETWLLLNRHEQDGRLFEWGAWYFDFQRRFDETALLLKNAAIGHLDGAWPVLHRAHAQVRSAQYDEAEETLRAAMGKTADETPPGRRRQPLWQVPANLALLLEVKGNPQEALKYYVRSDALLAAVLFSGTPPGPADGPPPRLMANGPGPARDLARVQFRMARCLRALGREGESRRALEYALDLDPDNLEVRLELRRLANN